MIHLKMKKNWSVFTLRETTEKWGCSYRERGIRTIERRQMLCHGACVYYVGGLRISLELITILQSDKLDPQRELAWLSMHKNPGKASFVSGIRSSHLTVLVAICTCSAKRCWIILDKDGWRTRFNIKLWIRSSRKKCCFSQVSSFFKGRVDV